MVRFCLARALATSPRERRPTKLAIGRSKTGRWRPEPPPSCHRELRWRSSQRARRRRRTSTAGQHDIIREQRPGPLCAQVPDRSRCRGQVVARLRADPEVRIGAPILASGMVRVGANPSGRRRAISFWKNACRSPPIPPARHDSRLYPALRLPVTSPVSNRTGRRQSLD